MSLIKPTVPGLALLLAACSGGGSGSGPGPGATLLGERELPGFQVAVSREAARVTVQVTPVDGAAAPAQVEAVVGQTVAWDLALSGQDLGGGRYAWTMPAGGAGRVWVRITDTDGDTLESGSEDFMLP